MCGDPEKPETWCKFCDDMSDGARGARWRLYLRLRLQKTNGGEVKKPEKWCVLPDIVTEDADCRWKNTNRGMMHEVYEHPLLLVVSVTAVAIPRV